MSPRWASPIFSDLRNAIGENVVFSYWKGRPYMRAWVKPANPKTNKQVANRLELADLVKRYQSLMADADVKAEWNEEALPYVISGFNIFLKWGRLSQISCPATGEAASGITVTYTCGIPLAKAMMCHLKDSTWTILKDAGELEAGVDKTVDTGALAAGTYYFWLGDKDVLKSGDTAPMAYQNITKWKPDETNGVLLEAKCVLS